MKLNLPTTWTIQKINVLLLITWLSANRSEAGRGFKNCLTSDDIFHIKKSDFTSYNHLLNFPFANNSDIENGKMLSLCCSGSQCYIPRVICDDVLQFSFNCMKIAQTVFCEGTYCSGIIGDELITTNTTIGPCEVDFNTMEKYISSINNYELSVNASGGYADYNSGNYSDGIKCNWDNGGWTCYEPFRDTINNYSNASCHLQWTASFPTIETINYAGSSSPKEKHLEKIIILSVIGSLVVALCASRLVHFYTVKPKRKKHQRKVFADEIRELGSKDDVILLSSSTIQLNSEEDSSSDEWIVVEHCSKHGNEFKRKILGKSLPVENWKDSCFKEVDTFSTWWNPNCALVIKEKASGIFSTKYTYSLWIVIYEEPFGKTKENFYINDIIPKHSTLNGVREEASEIKYRLMHNRSPALALSHNFFSLYKDSRNSYYKFILYSSSLVVKEKVVSLENPDDYIKPLDIIKRKIGKTGLYHFAIYLGNKQVAHVSNYDPISGQLKEYKEKLKDKTISRGSCETEEWLKNKIDQLKKDLENKEAKVQITPWDYFLLKHDKEREVKRVTRYHLLIPFKKPGLILEHIKKAVTSEFGKKEHEKYDLLLRNCEHFANVCVTGVWISEQQESAKEWGSILAILIPFVNVQKHEIRNLEKLVNKINESNEFFSYLEESKPLTQEETRILKKLQAKLSKSQSINHLIQDEQMNDIRENTEIILNIGCSRNSEEIELVPLIKSQIEILPKK